jgi:hypothetical protein
MQHEEKYHLLNIWNVNMNLVVPTVLGGCYSEFGCLKRTTHICEITKLQSKAAEKYWKKIDDLKQNVYK